MRYGTIDLKIEYGSVTITKSKVQRVRHFIDTDRNIVTELGRMPIRINCTALVKGHEKLALETMLASGEGQALIYRDKLYKDVHVSDTFEQEPSSYESGDRWRYNITFIALDPRVYDGNTEGVLY